MLILLSSPGDGGLGGIGSRGRDWRREGSGEVLE